jgi:hypothetical protein
MLLKLGTPIDENVGIARQTMAEAKGEGALPLPYGALSFGCRERGDRFVTIERVLLKLESAKPRQCDTGCAVASIEIAERANEVRHVYAGRSSTKPQYRLLKGGSVSWTCVDHRS